MVGCGGGGATTGSTATTPPPRTTATTPARPALSVALHAPRRAPRAGAGWPVRITARARGGGPVDGTVSYAFLFGGAVVARRPGGHMRHGTYRDTLRFPARAAGIPITLRVIVRANGRTGTTERHVQVRR